MWWFCTTRNKTSSFWVRAEWLNFRNKKVFVPSVGLVDRKIPCEGTFKAAVLCCHDWWLDGEGVLEPVLPTATVELVYLQKRVPIINYALSAIFCYRKIICCLNFFNFVLGRKRWESRQKNLLLRINFFCQCKELRNVTNVSDVSKLESYSAT